jgi:hypothetical protein
MLLNKTGGSVYWSVCISVRLVSINACATAKGRIAQPLLKGAWLQQSIGCAAVQLHMPARMHMRL